MTIKWITNLICDRCGLSLESDTKVGTYARPGDWAEVTIKGVDYHLCPTCVTVLRDWIKRGRETKE